MGLGTPHLYEESPSCPFCSFSVASRSKLDNWELQQHVQLAHMESEDSPFRIRAATPSSRGASSTRDSRVPSLSPHSAHAAGASRSLSRTPSDSEDEGDWYFECPWEGCGEAVHIREREHHQDLHDKESMASEDELDRPPSSCSSASFEEIRGRRAPSALLAPPPLDSRRSRVRSASPNLLTPPQPPNSAPHSKRPTRSSRGVFLGPAPRKTRLGPTTVVPSSPQRLGKSELGPHAYEKQMPKWLYKQLARGPEMRTVTEIGPYGKPIRMVRAINETAGIIPVLAQLCEQDRSLSKVFLCHPSVRHVFKLPREGGFCGYRNIQMQISFLQDTGFPGSEYFPGQLPTILRLQDLIEQSWDDGFNPQSRIETGGIKGTRKYIGTPEAQSLFSSLGIGVETNAFNKPPDADSYRTYVHDGLLEAVFNYFSTGVTDPTQKVYRTGLAPIYFQHPGHSMTIVGLEVRKRGLMNLLVFDPMFRTPGPVTKLVGKAFELKHPSRLLGAFRRGDSYLGKYNSFEIMKLTAPAPAVAEELERLHIGRNSSAPVRSKGTSG